MKFLYLVLVPLAIAAPVANSQLGAGERSLAVRDANAAPAVVDKVEARGNIFGLNVDDLMTQVEASLHGVPGLTDNAINNLLAVIRGILSGKPLDPSSLKALKDLPADVLADVVDVLSPILVPAVAGFPGVNIAVWGLLALLKSGNLLGGLGFKLFKRDDALEKALDGAFGPILEKISKTLHDIPGVTQDIINMVIALVRGLLTTGQLDQDILDKLHGLDGGLAGAVLGSVKTIIATIPFIGPVIAGSLNIPPLAPGSASK